MLDLAKRLEYLEELAIHAGISWVGSVPGTMIVRSLLPERGVGWTVSFGPLQSPKLHYQAPTLDEALTLAENDLKARAQKKKREIRIRVREEEDAYSSSYEHDPDITWTARRHPNDDCEELPSCCRNRFRRTQPLDPS